LISKKTEAVVPPENLPQSEDTIPEEDGHSGFGIDDSNVPIQSVINNIIHKKVPKGYVIVPDHGGIEANADAETFEEVVEEELGHGKWKRQPNTQYSAFKFWQHSDSEGDE
jgi:hypothetical protein